AVELRGKLTRALLEIAHRRIRHAPFIAPGEAGLFPQHRGGAALHRVGDVRATVGALARIGEEGDARTAAAAIRGERGDHRALCGEPREQLLGIEVGHDSLTYFPWLRRRHPSRSDRAARRAAPPSGAGRPA